MTAFYMFRLMGKTFYGDSHVDPAVEPKVHESPRSMTVPLIVLAALSIVAGAILGLTRGSSAAHIARAALEAIAVSSAELVSAMNNDLATPIVELRVDGGAARNDLLMQMQADLSGLPVLRPTNIETTALGAAYLAGLEAGIWADTNEVAMLWKPERVFEPKMLWTERTDRLRAWHRAVERTLGWAAAE
jgi:glycerol kinase